MTSKLTITDERLAELVAFKPLPGTDINSATRDEWMAMAAELQERRNAERGSEPVAWQIHTPETGVTYVETKPQSVENIRNGFGIKVEIAPLYRHAQPAPVVDADDNFYSWFGREWQENYQHNQYTTAAKQMLGVMAESAWKAGRRAAMLQAGALTNEDTRQVDELTMWIKRLVRSLKNANPDSKLPREAMDYLTAKGLISVGDILR